MTTPQEARAVAQWLHADFEGNAIDEAAAMLTEYADLLERQEPVAWMFQHDETGRMTCLANDGVNTPESFLRDNTRHAFVSALYAAPPAAVSADTELLRKDAERYRWLRDVNNMRARELFRYYGDVDASQLDAAIDAAMSAAPAVGAA